MSSQAQLRRYQSTLATSGLAVIAFGVWTIAKMFLLAALGGEGNILDLEAAGVEDDLLSRIIYYGFLAIFLGADLWLRLYVGRSAIAESDGRPRGWLYVVLVGLMVALNGAFAVAAVVTAASLLSLAGSIGSGIVELSGLMALVDLLYSAIRVKRLSKALAAGGGR